MVKHSRQRDAIYNFLQGRTDHPTADFIYSELRREYPNLSLGTVYRNLMVLKSQGLISAVQVGDGSIHFDPDTSFHDHFICSCCGAVQDIRGGIPAAERITGASESFHGKIRGCVTYYYGLCDKCEKQASAESWHVQDTM